MSWLQSGRSHLLFSVHRRYRHFVCALSALGFIAAPTNAATDPETIGLAALKREQPSLIGAGVRVGQPEVSEVVGSSDHWEVNPGAVGQPVSLFTWVSGAGTAVTYPNAVGLESEHANWVGLIFYGATGAAPGVAAVRSYEVNHYINSIITGGLNTPDMVVNNSWIAGVDSNLELFFDNYAAVRNVLFVSGMNNAEDTPPAPGSMYNGIGVGRSEGPSSVGPTSDGRSKPDLVVPGGDLVSYVTPLVSGSAALLIHAGARGDGGTGTAALATNASTIKALLLNGAVKQHGWTNGVARPLDARWGAGDLNIYNSWLQLRGGRAPAIATTTVTANGPHPPTSHSANASTLRGWDHASLTSTAVSDAVAHYYFLLPTNGVGYIGNVSLVWKRAVGAASARNLDLFLYDMTNTNLVASSQSTIDNVEHLFATNLPPGRYNLQVLRRGSPGQMGTESYALAFDFVAPRLSIHRTNGSVRIAWPVNQARLVLQESPTLSSPLWANVTAAPVVTNGLNTVTLSSSGSMRYFRLFRP